MNDIVLCINTATNVFALLPAITAYRRQMYKTSLLLSTSFVASSLMHITETKHDLIPFFLKDWSSVFLNLDRGIALLVFLTSSFILVERANKLPYKTILAKGCIGLLCLGLGEITKSLPLYTALHTLWHYYAFTSVNDILSY